MSHAFLQVTFTPCCTKPYGLSVSLPHCTHVQLRDGISGSFACVAFITVPRVLICKRLYRARVLIVAGIYFPAIEHDATLWQGMWYSGDNRA